MPGLLNGQDKSSPDAHSRPTELHVARVPALVSGSRPCPIRPIASPPGELGPMRIKGVLVQKRSDHGAERPVLHLLVSNSMNAFVLIPRLKSIEAIYAAGAAQAFYSGAVL